MPDFTEDESKEIMGSADFLGLNLYTSNLAYPTAKEDIDPSVISWKTDSDVTDLKDPKWYSAASPWLKVAPFGLRRMINWAYKNYKKPIYVTENGFSDYIGKRVVT